MKIFLSHAHEDEKLAARIAYALRESGHIVFLDSDSIRPSDEYNRNIREEISGCDLFVFLASAKALDEGSYTLSEVELARQRFPKPAGRVLTVLVGGVKPQDLPPFLAAVSVLRAKGDPAVETASAVEEIVRKRTTRRRRWIAAAAVVLLGAGAMWWSRGSMRANTGVQIEDARLVRVRHQFESWRDEYVLRAVIANRGTQPHQLDDFDIECLPNSFVAKAFITPRDIVLAPDESRVVDIAVSFERSTLAYEQDLAGLRWRLRLHVLDETERVSDWFEFHPEGAFENGTLAPLAAFVRTHARFVAQGDQAPRDSITLATIDPPELWDMDASGKLRRVAALDAEPTALAASGDCVAVGAVGAIRLFVGPTAELHGPYALDAVAVSDDPKDGRSYSIVPRSIAVRSVEEPAEDDPARRVIDIEVWVRAQDADAPPFLSRFSSTRETFTTPFAAGWASARSSVSELCNELGLRVIDGDVYGATSAWGPGTVVKAMDGDFVVTSGRDEALVACSWDVAPAPGSGVLLVDCERNLVHARRSEGTLVSVQTLAKLPIAKTTPTARETQRISVCRGRALIAINRFSLQPPESGTQLFSWTVEGGVQLLSTLDRCETVALATLEGSGCAVLRMADGKHQAVRIDYSSR